MESDGRGNADDLDALRVRAARTSQWNIGYFVAGFLFWLYAAGAGHLLEIDDRRFALVAGTFFIFPVAVGASRLLGADPFGKGNPLTELVGYTHMSVIALSFPLIVAIAIHEPDALILVMAVLYCIDFFVMTWAFGTRLFALHAAGRVVLASSAWFIFPDSRAVVLPLMVAGFYLVTVVTVPLLRRSWMRRHA
ncbi:MAG: hypothetical protein V2I43_00705 [Parvularcula sp.]|nr:hypothetical protein [Parvularcula sp.]